MLLVTGISLAAGQTLDSSRYYACISSVFLLCNNSGYYTYAIVYPEFMRIKCLVSVPEGKVVFSLSFSLSLELFKLSSDSDRHLESTS